MPSQILRLELTGSSALLILISHQVIVIVIFVIIILARCTLTLAHAQTVHERQVSITVNYSGSASNGGLWAEVLLEHLAKVFHLFLR